MKIRKMSAFSQVMKFILFVIGSYFLVHILGFFGLFVVVAYPIWCLISLKKVPCFFCRPRKEGEICPACKISIKDNERFPKTTRSVVLNTLAIFLVFILSLGVIFVEAKVLQVFGYSPVAKTVAFAIPTKGQYRLGEVFPMDIDLANVKTSINTVQADLSFDHDLLQVMDISTENSFAKIFVQKEIQNENGFARISGGLPNPGASCDTCHFASVIFKTLKPGTAVVEYLPSSLVLANDGKGTNVIKVLGSTAFIILPEKVDSSQLQRQEVYLQTNVLGESTQEDENQLHLYKGRVLAENTLSQTQGKPGVDTGSWIKKAFNALVRLDLFVINFWEKIFGVK